MRAEWTEVESADYEVWVSLSSAGITWNQETVTKPEYTATVHSRSFGAFTMWVRAIPSKNSEAAASEWSQPATLVIETQLTVSTKAVKGDERPRFTWDPANSVDRHEVWINNVTTGESQFIHESFVVHPEYTPRLDLHMGRYDIWVRPISGWAKGSWSEAIHHEVDPSPTQTHFATFDPRPTLSWSDLDGVVGYDLQISSASGVRTLSNLTQPQWSPDVGFDQGTTQWWVRGITPDGKPGAWSETAYVFLNQTGNLTAEVTHTTDPTEYRWTAMEGTASYQLFVQRLDDGKVIANISGITSNVWSGVSLNPGEYRIWARPTDANGNQGRWSAPTLVTTEIPTIRIGLEECDQTTYFEFPTRVQKDFHPLIPEGTVRAGYARFSADNMVVYNAEQPGTRVTHATSLRSFHLEAGAHEWQAISRDYYQLGRHLWNQEGYHRLSYWSDPVSFFIVGPDSRGGNINELTYSYGDSRPGFAWSAIDETASYRLYLEGEQGQQTFFSLQTNLWDPTFDLPDGLWHWWVRPIDQNGQEGAPTERVPFIIATNE